MGLDIFVSIGGKGFEGLIVSNLTIEFWIHFKKHMVTPY
jgi:hypothetical protein